MFGIATLAAGPDYFPEQSTEEGGAAKVVNPSFLGDLMLSGDVSSNLRELINNHIVDYGERGLLCTRCRRWTEPESRLIQ